ncbi:MAG: helicase SNF2 [Cyanobacteria bacterium J06635_10]
MYQITSEIEAALNLTSPQQKWELNKNAIASLKNGDRDLDALAKFNGWGAIHEIFDENKNGWCSTARKELKELLGDSEYAKASNSIVNAHYTSPNIARVIWQIVQKLGFQSGRIIDPCCGTGIFFGTMPITIAENSKLYGVELDAIPSQITSMLYPEASVYNRGFEQTDFPDNYFDLAISNIPFGSYRLHDPKHNHLQANIHNYFLAKLSDLVRPGGLITVINSTYTLDAKSSKFRTWLGNKLKLIEAIRLPNNTFENIARTEVTTDILVFQKVSSPSESNIAQWCFTKEIKVNGELVQLNQIYRKHQDSMLGKPSINKLYGNGFSLAPVDNINVQEKLEELTNKIEPQYSSTKLPESIIVPEELQSSKLGTFVKYLGSYYKREAKTIVKVDEENSGMIDEFLELHSILKSTINAQNTGIDIKLWQKKLLKQYETFINSYGKLNSKQNIQLLGSDPRYYIVRTLEKGGGIIDIFYKKLCKSYSPPFIANNLDEAISHSINYKGKLDFEFICNLLKWDYQKLIDELVAKDVIYLNSQNNQWENKDEYLSGNIYAKLKIARYCDIERNIQALKAARPIPLLPPTNHETIFKCLENLDFNWNELDAKAQEKILSQHLKAELGTSFVATKFYSQFALEVMGIKVKITYFSTQSTSAYQVDGSSKDLEKYGTPHRDSSKILNYALNNQDPIVSIYHNEEYNKAASDEATIVARGKIEALKLAWNQWVWSCESRSIEIAVHFNTHINVFTPRKYDGSYLTLIGSNPNIKLRTQQKNAIARILASRTTFVGHEVGLGKTFILIASAMEARRLGIARKPPVLVVLNGTEQQIYKDWKLLYPLANVFVPKSFNKDGRKLFTAALATSEFDGAIITHSQFFSLTVGAEYKIAYIEQEKEILQKWLSEEGNNNKRIKSALNRLSSRINEIIESDRKDNHIEFADLCDFLLFDEIDVAKNLYAPTKMGNVRGIQSRHSQRATDTYLKALYVQGNLFYASTKYKGKFVGASGTIISNSLVEIFTWQRFFQLDRLQELGIDNLDAWISQFAKPVTGIELSSRGTYKSITRLKQFNNMVVLKRIVSEFLDICTFDMVKDLCEIERPQAQYIEVISTPSKAQLSYLNNCLDRAKAIEERKVEPSEDNYLKLTGDLTKAALWMRLLGNSEPEPIDSKLHKCIWNVWKIWKATTSIKSTQVIFCDLSTPKPGRYCVYNYLKDFLVALGIPQSQITFIHDWNKNKRNELYQLVDEGKIRIVIANTHKGGVGVNIHRRGLIAAHQIQCPWRERDVTQQEGRLIRQGNGSILGTTLKRCYIFRYVTERLDAFRWQTIAYKQKMTWQFMNGEEINELEDIDKVVLDFQQISLMATGNSLLQEKAQLQDEAAKLQVLKVNHDRTQLQIKSQIKDYQREVSNEQTRFKAIESDIKRIQQLNSKDKPATKLAIHEAVNIAYKSKRVSKQYVTNYRSFDVNCRYCPVQKKVIIGLIGDAQYSITKSRNDNPIELINGFIDNLSDYRNEIQNSINNKINELTRLSKIAGEPFEFENKLQEIWNRINKIDLEIQSQQQAIVANNNSSNAETNDINDDNLEEENTTIDENIIIPKELVKAIKTIEDNPQWLQQITRDANDIKPTSKKMEIETPKQIQINNSKQLALF